jgi:hypothetical protein
VAKAQVAVAGAEERGESEQPGGGASRHRRSASTSRYLKFRGILFLKPNVL